VLTYTINIITCIQAHRDASVQKGLNSTDKQKISFKYFDKGFSQPFTFECKLQSGLEVE